ncbi:MAG: Transcriptional regulator, AsnC family [uncultured Caballeronia sp.]|nr:MAG: Transcriptional regulator, AsnC family [uncultured Caballeronia sp.]
MRVVVSDIDDYDRVYKTLIRAVPLYDVSSSFAMERSNIPPRCLCARHSGSPGTEVLSSMWNASCEVNARLPQPF